MSMAVSFGLVCHLGISFIIGCVTSMDTCPKGLTTNTSLIHHNRAFIALFQALFININPLGCVSMRAIELIRVPAPLPEHDHDIRARTYGALGWQAGSSCWIHITSSLLNASIPMVMLSTTFNLLLISFCPFRQASWCYSKPMGEDILRSLDRYHDALHTQMNVLEASSERRSKLVQDGVSQLQSNL